MYRATIYIPSMDKTVTVFPRNKKTSFFKTQKLALRAMERKARHWSFDSFGRVKNANGELVTNIAL